METRTGGLTMRDSDNPSLPLGRDHGKIYCVAPVLLVTTDRASPPQLAATETEIETGGGDASS
jgi:hypothetical protein